MAAATGRQHAVVVNLMSVDGVDYLVSPRGNTQWARNARAAGVVEVGPRWRARLVTVTEVSDEAKPPLLARYLDRLVLGGQRARRRPDAAVHAARAAGRCSVDPGFRARLIAPAPAMQPRRDNRPQVLLNNPTIDRPALVDDTTPGRRSHPSG